MQKEMDGLSYKGGCETAWDDVTSAELEPGPVKKAREVEMGCFAKLGVYEHVPRSRQDMTGRKIIGVRWVDVHKSNSTDPEYRSRLVGR